ncbi:MAG: helix-turn-helix domain-containing protein [Propionibacteriaceae bacterium]|nr:helix-turn-helix domain-containing protein [Propionibacteriaceae bacterium]
MAVRIDHPVFDGTTGRGDHRGRRTHVIRLLRDSKEPLTVEQVAKRVGLPPNAARFHLESLVEAGFAVRMTQNRATPGRPRVAYLGTLPTQTDEREQGYRLLSEILATAVASANGDADEWMYRAGIDWGRCITSRCDPECPLPETDNLRGLVEKLDALWFAPELAGGDPPTLVLYNFPFLESTRRFPQVLCQLNAGLVNGILEEMHSGYRLGHLRANLAGHRCEGDLVKATGRVAKVPLEVTANHHRRTE